MTTIVYDHSLRQIAVDGRSNSSGIIKSESRKKWIIQGKDIWFFAGAHCDIHDFLCAFDGIKPNRDLDCISMAVIDGIAYWCGVDNNDGTTWRQPLEDSDAVGSGQQFALAALDFGKSAKEAVEYAATRDCYTGGKVSVYDIALGSFIE